MAELVLYIVVVVVAVAPPAPAAAAAAAAVVVVVVRVVAIAVVVAVAVTDAMAALVLACHILNLQPRPLKARTPKTITTLASKMLLRERLSARNREKPLTPHFLCRKIAWGRKEPSKITLSPKPYNRKPSQPLCRLAGKMHRPVPEEPLRLLCAGAS